MRILLVICVLCGVLLGCEKPIKEANHHREDASDGWTAMTKLESLASSRS